MAARSGGLDRAHPRWARYEELRPDQLRELVAATPIAYWPLGLLEHHGWHLPVGLDGLKADRFCQRIAAITGGAILPTMWWGGGGGHGDFMWTLYQSEAAAEEILVRTVEGLISFGFRALVLFAGHYPWRRILDKRLPPIEQNHPAVLFLWGTEMGIGGDAVRLPGDHAAREETSYALALHPEFVNMGALRPGRDVSAWPAGQAPDLGEYPGLVLDPADPCFAQYGEDARTGSRERGEEAAARLVTHLARLISEHLNRSA